MAHPRAFKELRTITQPTMQTYLTKLCKMIKGRINRLVGLKTLRFVFISTGGDSKNEQEQH